jgi:hypothetical protein
MSESGLACPQAWEPNRRTAPSGISSRICAAICRSRRQQKLSPRFASSIVISNWCRDSCHSLYKSPGTTGWNSIAVFPRTTKQFYGQVVLHGCTGNRFGGLPSAMAPAPISAR